MVVESIKFMSDLKLKSKSKLKSNSLSNLSWNSVKVVGRPLTIPTGILIRQLITARLKYRTPYSVIVNNFPGSTASNHQC